MKAEMEGLKHLARRTLRDGDREWSYNGSGGSHSRLEIDEDTTISFTYPDEEMLGLAPGDIYVTRRVRRLDAPRPYAIYRIDFDADVAARISRLAALRGMRRSILDDCEREADEDLWTYGQVVAENSCELGRVDEIFTILDPTDPDNLQHLGNGVYEARWLLLEEGDVHDFTSLLRHPRVLLLGKPFSPVRSVVAVRFGVRKSAP